MEIGKKFRDLVGTEVTIDGNIFSVSKSYDKPQTFQCLDVRRGRSIIMNWKTGEDVCYTVQLLLKNDSMKRSQWSQPFPDYESPIKKSDK